MCFVFRVQCRIVLSVRHLSVCSSSLWDALQQLGLTHMVCEFRVRCMIVLSVSQLCVCLGVDMMSYGLCWGQPLSCLCSGCSASALCDCFECESTVRFLTVLTCLGACAGFNLCVACVQGAVQVLYLIQDILPAVIPLTKQLVPLPLSSSVNIESSMSDMNVPTTSQHYAVMESEHPYKPASVANYKVCLKQKYIDCFVWCQTFVERVHL